MGVQKKLQKIVKIYTKSLEVYIHGKYFQQHIVPYFNKHRTEKNISRALLHCKRD